MLSFLAAPYAKIILSGPLFAYAFATGGYCPFLERKGPKELSDSIRYALGSAS
jgi:hypothetical protein